MHSFICDYINRRKHSNRQIKASKNCKNGLLILNTVDSYHEQECKQCAVHS